MLNNSALTGLSISSVSKYYGSNTNIIPIDRLWFLIMIFVENAWRHALACNLSIWYKVQEAKSMAKIMVFLTFLSFTVFIVCRIYRCFLGPLKYLESRFHCIKCIHELDCVFRLVLYYVSSFYLLYHIWFVSIASGISYLKCFRYSDKVAKIITLWCIWESARKLPSGI